MERTDDTARRIADMFAKADVKSVKVASLDRFGLEHPIRLESGDCNGNNEWENYEVFVVYSTLEADTNFGRINLLETVFGEDDWFDIEDVIADALGC